MGAAAVRAGSAFVEIGADPRKLFAALNKINKQIGSLGSSMSAAGRKVMGAGLAVAAPFGAAVAAGTRFQDVMLAVRASTGATADQVQAVRAAALAMSQALGVGPTEAASGFLELLKAGMSVEQVLGGAGEAAIAFAKVGNMAVSDAAVVMADAMKVFGVTGDVAANTLSAAADSSSTSIEGIALAFSQVSAVAGLANQSIQDTAAAIAILANAGIKGSDAGTSLKTMLMRLMAPADDAVGALEQLGLSVSSFRNADGTMKPMVEIIRTLSTAMEGMDQAAKDDIFRRIFGQDAIRAAAVMTATGVDGFNAMRDSMAGAATVGEKYAMTTSGISGTVGSLLAALERLAIAITDAVGPAFQAMVAGMTPVVDGLTKFAVNNQSLVVGLAQGAGAAVLAGAALLGVGAALKVVAVGMALVSSPIGLIVAGIGLAAGAVAYFSGVLDEILGVAQTTFGGMYAAIAEGDLAGAMDILWAGLYAGWLTGVEVLMGAVDSFVAFMQNTFTYMWAGIKGVFGDSINWVLGAFDNMVAAVQKSWNYVQSFIKKGFDLEKENRKVDDANSARKREREAARGMDKEMAAADKTAAERYATNEKRAEQRRQETAAATGSLDQKARGAKERRAQNDQYAQLLKDIEAATTIEQLRDLYGEFDALSSNGRLTSAQAATLEVALEDAQERITKDAVHAGGAAAAAGGAAPGDVAAGADAAAADSSQSQGDSAGTFSAMAAGAMGVGSSIPQKQLDALQKIEKNTREGDGGVVQE